MRDPFGQRNALPLFEDALSAGIRAVDAPHMLELAPGAQGAPLAQALLSPATLMALPMVASGRLDHWVVLGSTLRGRFEREHLEQLWLEAAHAVSLMSRALTGATLASRTSSARPKRSADTDARDRDIGASRLGLTT